MSSSNYSATGLVDSFHNLPHYDLSLNKVSNEFKYDDEKYLESLASFAVPWIVLPILFGLMLCCANRKRSRPRDKYERIQDNDNDPVKSWRKWVLVATVIIVLMSPLEYYANEEITKGVKLFSDRLNGAQSLYNVVIEQSEETKIEVDALFVNISGTTLPDESMKAEILAQLTSASNALNTVSGFSGAVNIASASEDVLKYDKTRWEVMMGFAAALLLTGIVGYCGKTKGAPGACCFNYVIAILAFIITGIFFAAAVGFADFCADPNAVIDTLLPSDGTTRDAALYYINCPPGETSPFLADIDEALIYINETATEMGRQCEIAPDVCGIYSGMVSVNASAMELIEEVECSGLHSEYVGALDAVCVTTLEGFLMAIIGIAISSFAIVLSSFSLIKVKKALGN